MSIPLTQGFLDKVSAILAHAVDQLDAADPERRAHRLLFVVVVFSSTIGSAISAGVLCVYQTAVTLERTGRPVRRGRPATASTTGGRLHHGSRRGSARREVICRRPARVGPARILDERQAFPLRVPLAPLMISRPLVSAACCFSTNRMRPSVLANVTVKSMPAVSLHVPSMKPIVLASAQFRHTPR